MYSVIHHRVTAAYELSLQTTSFSDLKSSGKTFRPVRRRFTTFLSSGTIPLKLRQCRTQCHIHARTIWYSSIPRFAVKSLKLPIAGATIGAGGFGYANYKFEELRKKSDAWIKSVQTRATDAFDSASGTLLSVSAQVPEVKLQYLLFNDFVPYFEYSGEDGGPGESWEQSQPPNGKGSAVISALVAATFSSPSNLSSDNTSCESGQNGLLVLRKTLAEIWTMLLNVDQGDTLMLRSILTPGTQNSGKSSVFEAIISHEKEKIRRLTETIENAAIGRDKSTDFSHIQQTFTDLSLAVPSTDPEVQTPTFSDFLLIDPSKDVQIASLNQTDIPNRLADPYPPVSVDLHPVTFLVPPVEDEASSSSVSDLNLLLQCTNNSHLDLQRISEFLGSDDSNVQCAALQLLEHAAEWEKEYFIESMSITFHPAAHLLSSSEAQVHWAALHVLKFFLASGYDAEAVKSVVPDVLRHLLSREPDVQLASVEVLDAAVQSQRNNIWSALAPAFSGIASVLPSMLPAIQIAALGVLEAGVRCAAKELEEAIAPTLPAVVQLLSSGGADVQRTAVDLLVICAGSPNAKLVESVMDTLPALTLLSSGSTTTADAAQEVLAAYADSHNARLVRATLSDTQLFGR